VRSVDGDIPAERRTNPPESPFWTALAPRREDIARQWLARACADYPPETAAFIAAGGDPFANPVGDRLQSAARAFARVLVTPRPLPEEEEDLAAALDDLMRVQAIQALTPEEAVGAFFSMKAILRASAAALPGAEAAEGPLLELDGRVDRVVLAAFGRYCRCRESLFALREGEIRRRRAGLSRLLRAAESGKEERP
jgi:hypothetical protein